MQLLNRKGQDHDPNTKKNERCKCHAKMVPGKAVGPQEQCQFIGLGHGWNEQGNICIEGG